MHSKKVLIPEVDVDPIGDLMVDYLIALDREDAFLDFKEIIELDKDHFPKLAKDIFAFSNVGSGFILIGFRDAKNQERTGRERKRSFTPVGLPQEFELDQAVLQEKFNSFSNIKIELSYREFFKNFDGKNLRFGIIYVPPSTVTLIPTRAGNYTDLNEKKKSAFKEGDIFIRRGTQSILATEGEKEYIKTRAERSEYRNSVLTGEPDDFPENIFSNLLEVKALPESILEVSKREGDFDDLDIMEFKKSRVPYKLHNKKLYTFHDDDFVPSLSSKLFNSIRVRHLKIRDWIEDPLRQNLIKELLEKELSYFARNQGIYTNRKKRKNRFYYPCKYNSRTERWITRFGRNQPVLVASLIYSEKSGRNLMKHRAVDFQFLFMQGQVFLNLLPTIILTSDGKNTISDFEEGYLITKQLYRNHNSQYLNSMLFWAYKLSNGNEQIGVIPNKFIIDSRPIQLEIDVGIAWDRPVSELLEEL